MSAHMNHTVTAYIESYEGSTDGLRFGRLRLKGKGIPANVSRHFCHDRLNNTVQLIRINEAIDRERDTTPDSDPAHVAAAMAAFAEREGTGE